MQKIKRFSSAIFMALAIGLIAPVSFASELNVSGYIREQVSINLEDPVETTQDDKYDVSMARTTLRLDFDGDVAGIGFSVIGRASREIETDYLKRLQKTRKTVFGSTDDLVDDNYDETEIREAVLEFGLGDRTTLRLGKQQVAWGETDFFAGLDVIHGFDYSWRSFLEVENEELRKPLIMANVMIQVPEARGTLQLLLRPGLDSDEDIGNTYDLFGGRWANQPNKGVDFFGNAFNVQYNYDHKEGDADDANYGFRWSGIAGDYNYSIGYWKGINPDPVVNTVINPYKGEVKGAAFAEFIYPHVDTLGVTLSSYSPATDAVWSAEFAYTADKPYNVGSVCAGGFAPAGFCGIVEKNTLRSMIRMDKQLDMSAMLGTSRPSFFSIQVFDSWLTDFKNSDDIVDLAGYSALKKEHSTIATMLLAMNYANDQINPTLAIGYDVSYGGGFFIPSVEFALGDNWRIRAEADIFFDDGDNNKAGADSSDTHLMGYFSNNDQLAVRVTYQF